MKVMCICDDQILAEGGANDSARVVFGEVYTVINSFRHKGVLMYDLQEIDGASFDADLFAPLSNIDETELANAQPAHA